METLEDTPLATSELSDSKKNVFNTTDSHNAGSLLDFSMSFQQFGDLYLDKRLTFSLTETFKYQHPTLVQSKAIPILLQRKDALIQARTGSGKTLAYALPMIQHCLTTFSNNVPKPLFGCVLVPTKELATQVTSVFASLCHFLNSFITVRNTSSHLHRLSSEETPTILISTPKAFLIYLSSKQKQLGNDSRHQKGSKTFWRDKKTASQYNISSIFEKNIQCIVLDEADVLLGLGFKNNLCTLFKDILKNSTPGNRQYQITLCSATLSPEVLELKSMVLYKPAIIQLKGADADTFTNFSTGGLFEPQRSCTLCEFYFCCLPNEKYLVLYSLLKLSLLPMKCLIFVNSTQCAYTLLLLLRRFSIPSTVLCDSIPYSTRLRLLSSFQQGVYDILIAVDQSDTKEWQQNEILDETSTCPLTGTSESQKPSNSSVVMASSDTPKKQKKTKESEFGIHRGVDFKGVRCVLNFDVPLSLNAYIHRIGRTARAGACGIALTLFQSTHEDDMNFLQSLQNSRCTTLETTSSFKPLQLNMKNIECFRYRVADVLQSITPKTIASVRAYELQRDILCSARLKEHFEANPEDMKALKNAFKSIQITQQDDKHLKSIPSYFQSFVSHLQSSTAIETALLHLFQSEQEDPQSATKTFKGKRLQRSSDILKNLSASTGRKKRKSTHEILLNNLKKEPENYNTTPIDSLPTLSSRKLKHQVKKKFAKTKNRSNRHI